jgi:hypothetical protein
MTIDWSKDRVGTLSTPEILELQKNARARGVLEVVATCDLVLLTRKPIRRHSGPSVSTPTKILEAKCAKQLSDFAIHLIAKYDLSASTAAKLSEGAKGFKAHQVTAKNGQAKLGGDQRTGKVAIDRYISYRVRNEPVSLTALLISKESDEGLVWQVLGSPHHFKNFRPYSQLRPYASDTEGGLYRGGEEFIEFSDAAALFESLLVKLTSYFSK